MDPTTRTSANNPFEGIGYADFERMATDARLSPNERIGFPEQYRQGFGAAIFSDIRSKLSNLAMPGAHVLEVGPGCAELPRMLMEECERLNQPLVLVDSRAMLEQLPDSPQVTKVVGFYPDCKAALTPWLGKVDALLCYSVFHYVFMEASFWRFIDFSLELLAPGGQMLIGDIPNVSKRKRFFASEAGIQFHQEFMQTTEEPPVDFRAVETDKIDDAVILGVIMRVRSQGCDAYWLPQPGTLPMSNRREDVLIVKP